MTETQFSHCTYCGAAFPPGGGWPRTCMDCANITYRNPIPVSVVLIPLKGESGERGLLLVRRAIAPKMGELALPGGYVNYGETWQEAGAREVLEETGLQIEPSEINEFRVRSAPDGSLIIFGIASQIRRASELPPFIPNKEASECVALSKPAQLAFELHTKIVAEFFNPPAKSPGSRQPTCE